MRGLFDSGLCFTFLCTAALCAATVPAVVPAWHGLVRVDTDGRPLDDRRPSRLCRDCGCLVSVDDTGCPFVCPACRHWNPPVGCAE